MSLFASSLGAWWELRAWKGHSPVYTTWRLVLAEMAPVPVT